MLLNNKLGRNDNCPCGTGKKYKKCCLNKSFKDKVNDWRKNAYILLNDNPQKNNIITIYFELLKIVELSDWKGGCHSISLMLYILLKEIGVNAELCIGEVKVNDIIFDHSWVEVNNEIFDIAISNPLDSVFSHNPVFMGHDINNNNKITALYGVNSNFPRDSNRINVSTWSTLSYIEDFTLDKIFDDLKIEELKYSYDFEACGLWGFISHISKLLDLNFDISQMRLKYGDLKRVER